VKEGDGPPATFGPYGERVVRGIMVEGGDEIR
jgi:hypothetical protein